MLEKFERYPLTFGPTPIEKLARLSEHLGGGVPGINAYSYINPLGHPGGSNDP